MNLNHSTPWLFGDNRSNPLASPYVETSLLSLLNQAMIPYPSFSNVQPPKYSLGLRCRWIPNPQTDWGIVIGQIYIPNVQDLEGKNWSWLYLLLLDEDSPPRSWIAIDYVDEEDLEAFPSELSKQSLDPDVEAS